MMDLADIWPDNYEGRPQRVLPVTLVVDVGAHCAESRAAELRNGICKLDLFLRQHQELRHGIDIRLIAPRWSMAEVPLQVIRYEPMHAHYRDSKISLSSIIDEVLNDSEKRSAGQTTTAPQVCSPWLVLLSGGGSGVDVTWAPRANEQLLNKWLTVIPVIVGGGCDSALLLALGIYRPPLRLQRGGGLRFVSWLGKELQRVITAKPGKRVSLDIAGMAAWAQT